MLPYYAFTLFVSATLLFLVQPEIGKMILPRLGGTPAVWNTCMVFFQFVLLVGYGYTHVLTTWQSTRRQMLIHLGVLLLPFLVLPFRLGNWTPPAESNPVFSVLWLLLGMVGLPFFVVSTSAPLLQRWFGSTGHAAAKDPYFLYGASNFGSMVGLVGYPLLIEWLFDLDMQAWVWMVCYAIVVGLIAGCVAIAWKSVGREVKLAPIEPPAPPSRESAPVKVEQAITAKRGVRRRAGAATLPAESAPVVVRAPDRDQITWWRRLRWIALAAVPSSLMLGLTTEMTTDIAAVPFFWVLPLALYLLTFILVFARWPVVWTELPHTVVLYAQPCFLLFLVLIKVAELNFSAWIQIIFHIMAFVTTTLLCHGELAKDRPTARHLTEFYLAMSLGGVLGGMFNALLAPVVFTHGVAEYWIAMVVACACRPSMVTEFTLIPGDTDQERTTPLGWILEALLPVLLAGLACVFLYLILDPALRRGSEFPKRNYLMAIPVILLLTLAMRPLRFALGLALLLLATWFHDKASEDTIYQGRGFFGFVRVREERVTRRVDGRALDGYNVLIHGQIDHGRQHNEKRLRRKAISYFHPTNGIGQIFEQYSWPDARLPASLVGLGALPGSLPAGMVCDLHSEPAFAVIGLGTGTLAAHARPWQTLHIYEIDPLVRDLSDPPDDRQPYFTYFRDAQQRKADAHIIMGDGRLTLQHDMKDRHYPERAPTKKEKLYHILVLDAFSSDAIPVHLLTYDAVGEYLDKLADGGVLIFNTTNRYVDIRGVLGNIAAAHDLECMMYGDYHTYRVGNTNRYETIPDKFGTDWVVMRRNKTPSGPYNGGPPLSVRFEPRRLMDQLRPYYLSIERPDLVDRTDLFEWLETPTNDDPVWTDGYSNLLREVNWGVDQAVVIAALLGLLAVGAGPFVGGVLLLLSIRIFNATLGGAQAQAPIPRPTYAKAIGILFLVHLASVAARFAGAVVLPESVLVAVASVVLGWLLAVGLLVVLLPTSVWRAVVVALFYALLASLCVGILVGVVFALV